MTLQRASLSPFTLHHCSALIALLAAALIRWPAEPLLRQTNMSTSCSVTQIAYMEPGSDVKVLLHVCAQHLVDCYGPHCHATLLKSMVHHLKAPQSLPQLCRVLTANVNTWRHIYLAATGMCLVRFKIQFKARFMCRCQTATMCRRYRSIYIQLPLQQALSQQQRQLQSMMPKLLQAWQHLTQSNVISIRSTPPAGGSFAHADAKIREQSQWSWLNGRYARSLKLTQMLHAMTTRLLSQVSSSLACMQALDPATV